MTKFIRTGLAVLAVMISASQVSRADTCIVFMGTIYCGTVVDAPEINPTNSTAGLALLMGGILILRGRQKQRS